jgi:hypothetical protein
MIEMWRWDFLLMNTVLPIQNGCGDYSGLQSGLVEFIFSTTDEYCVWGALLMQDEKVVDQYQAAPDRWWCLELGPGQTRSEPSILVKRAWRMAPCVHVVSIVFADSCC